jgi:hypothetical protein
MEYSLIGEGKHFSIVVLGFIPLLCKKGQMTLLW